MTAEEASVELTPGNDTVALAQQLLYVASLDTNRYRVEDVKTTTSGPMGLAFLLPVGLYEAWQEFLGVPIEAEAVDPVEESPAPKAARGRKPKATTGSEE